MSNVVSEMLAKIFSYENERHLSDGQITRRIRRYGIRFFLQDLFKKKICADKLNICIIINGGVGDQVIQLQWVRLFLNTLVSENVTFYCCLAGSVQKNVEQLSQGIANIDKILSLQECSPYRFDLVLNMNYIPLIDEINWDSIEKFAPKLVDKFNSLAEQNLRLHLFNATKFHYTLQEYALARNLTRYDLLGESNFFEFNRYSQPFFFVEQESVQNTLEKFDLRDRTFITLHSGIGSIPNYGLEPGKNIEEVKQFATRVIPMDVCERIFSRLKEELPDVVLVQIGEPEGLIAKGADLCLIGKSSFKDSLDLLYAAAVHIDNDAGLVHVRHAMQKRSVVLWGPTSGKFVGYPEDINLQGNCDPCMWLTLDWNLKCPKGKPCAECMRSHNVESVVDGVKSILSN